MCDRDVKGLVEGVTAIRRPSVASPYSEAVRDILCKLIGKRVEVAFLNYDVDISVVTRYSEAIYPAMSEAFVVCCTTCTNTCCCA